MKKLLALFLSLMMMFSLTTGLAEDVESYFDGAWVQFQEGFELYLPSDWLMLDVTQEMLANGIFFAVCSPDETKTMQLSWDALEDEITIDELHAALAQNLPAVQKLDVGGIELLCVGDAENDSLMFIALDGTEPGFYTFEFTPLSDAELLAYATVIASSLRNVE